MTSSLWKSAKSVNQKLFPQFESLKQGRLSKLVDMYMDYKRAFKDVFLHIKDNPIKASIQTTILGMAIYTGYNNPDLNSYKEHLLTASNKHSLISDLIRNKKSIQTVENLMKYYSADRFIRVNLGVLSIVWLSPHSTYYDSFEKHCKDTQNRWVHIQEWKDNILDIGFLNKWYYLDKIMEDYDINEEEFVNR